MGYSIGPINYWNRIINLLFYKGDDVNILIGIAAIIFIPLCIFVLYNIFKFLYKILPDSILDFFSIDGPFDLFFILSIAICSIALLLCLGNLCFSALGLPYIEELTR